MASVTLARGRVQPVWAGHPWVFAQAISQIDGAPAPGDVVDVFDPERKFIGRGYWSPNSAIPIRIATRDPSDPLNGASLGKALERAAALRHRFGLPDAATTGYRLAHAEGDQLPGLIVDVFGTVATVQFLTIGMKLREQEIYAHVARVSGARSILEAKSHVASEREGFEAAGGVVRGPEIEAISFYERGLLFELEPSVTQKTGFYFDQRDQRALLERIARGARVLDLYCFVGAFAMAAARGGAKEVIAVDSSAPAIASASRQSHLNGLLNKIRFERADARKRMAELASQHERFDIVVLDPPKLAPTIKHLDRARPAYRKLNADAARLVAPGGVLITCSCSAAMTSDDFLRTVTLGARDAQRDLTLIHWAQQGIDHPTPAAFPEGRYLKCATFRVLP